MAIYEGDKKIIPFKGDYEPLAIYEGDKAVFEPLNTIKQGEDLAFVNTYNDKIRELTVYGKSVQDTHRIGVNQDKIVQFEDGLGGGYAIVEIKGDYPENTTFELTRCGRNLVEGGLSRLYNRDIAYRYHPNFLPSKKMYTQSNVKQIGGWAQSDLWESDTPDVTTVGNSMIARTNNGDPNTPNYLKTITGLKTKKYSFSRVGTENYQLNTQNIMVELGSTAHPYEPYQGETFTISPNTPTKIPLLNGVNTFFADEDVMLTVQYQKAENAQAEDTDIFSPTPDFPEEIRSVEGELIISGRESDVSQEIDLPVLREVNGTQDKWYQDGSWEQWIEGDFDETKPLERQTNLILSEPIHHLAPTDFAPLKTYPYVTNIETNSKIKPTMKAKVKTWQ